MQWLTHGCKQGLWAEKYASMGPEMWDQLNQALSALQPQGSTETLLCEPQQPAPAQTTHQTDVDTQRPAQLSPLYVWLQGHDIGYWGSPLKLARTKHLVASVKAGSIIPVISTALSKSRDAARKQLGTPASPRGPFSSTTSVPSLSVSAYMTALSSSSAECTLLSGQLLEYKTWPLEPGAPQQQLLRTTISTHSLHPPPGVQHTTTASLSAASGTASTASTRSLGPQLMLTTATKNVTHPQSHAPAAGEAAMPPTNAGHVAEAQDSAAGCSQMQPAGFEPRPVLAATCTKVLRRALTWTERPATDPALSWWGGEFQLPHGLELLLPKSRWCRISMIFAWLYRHTQCDASAARVTSVVEACSGRRQKISSIKRQLLTASLIRRCPCTILHCQYSFVIAHTPVLPCLLLCRHAPGWEQHVLGVAHSEAKGVDSAATPGVVPVPAEPVRAWTCCIIDHTFVLLPPLVACLRAPPFAHAHAEGNGC